MSLSTSRVTLEEITAETLRAVIELDVSPSQQKYVASNAVSIAEAHFNPGGWFRAVYAGGLPVGFVMLFDPTIPGAIASDPVEPTDMVLWRLMIDRRYQRQGLGRRTLDAVKEHIVGFWILECANLDEAMAWARKGVAATRGSVEIREIFFVPDPDQAAS